MDGRKEKESKKKDGRKESKRKEGRNVKKEEKELFC